MNYQDFFDNEVPELLSELTAEHTPLFGIMTAQHMVEHLVWVTKSTSKPYSPIPEANSESQDKFLSFIKSGAKFEYRPKDKKTEDLDPCRYDSLERAKEEIPIALQRMKDICSGDAEIVYNPIMGRLSKSELELFHYQHYNWHLREQFGLGS